MSLGHLYVFLGEVCVQVLCPFFNWVVCLPILCFETFHNLIDISIISKGISFCKLLFWFSIIMWNFYNVMHVTEVYSLNYSTVYHNVFVHSSVVGDIPRILLCIMCTYIFVHIIHRLLYPWHVIIIPMHNEHPYFSLKTLGKKVHIICSKHSRLFLFLIYLFIFAVINSIDHSVM